MLYYGQGPNNPSIDDISYLMNRVKGKQAVYVNVFGAYEDELIIHDISF